MEYKPNSKAVKFCEKCKNDPAINFHPNYRPDMCAKCFKIVEMEEENPRNKPRKEMIVVNAI